MRFPNLSPCEIPRAKLLQFFYEVPEFVPVRNTPCQTSAIFFFSMAHSHAWCQCHTLSLLSAATLPQVPMRFPNLSPCEIPRAKLLQFFFEVPEFVPVRNTPCQTSAIFFFSMAHSHMRFPNLSPCEIPRAKLLQFFF